MGRVDWPLLLFLAGAVYVKLYVKIAAVVLYAGWCLYRRYRRPAPPAPVVFYLLMPVLGGLAAGLQGAFGYVGSPGTELEFAL